MNERPSPLQRVAGVLGTTDAALSMGERLYRWWPAVGGVYTLLSYFAARWVHRQYSEWLTGLFVFAAAVCGLWLLKWLIDRDHRRAMGAEPDSASESTTTPAGSDERVSQLQQRASKLKALLEDVQIDHDKAMRRVQGELEAKQKEIERLIAEVERERGDKVTLNKEVLDRGIAVRNREDYINGLLWKIAYGGERPTLTEMPLTDQAKVRERVEEMALSLNRATDACSRLLTHLIMLMSSGDPECSNTLLARFVHERVFTRTYEARDRLVLVINSQDDIRLPLIGYYRMYTSARQWIVRSERILCWPQDVDDMYVRWYALDDAFHQELEKVLHRNMLANIRTYFTRDGEAPPSDPAKERDKLRR